MSLSTHKYILPTKIKIRNVGYESSISNVSLYLGDKSGADKWHKICENIKIEKGNKLREYPLSLFLTPYFVMNNSNNTIKMIINNNWGNSLYNQFSSFSVSGYCY